jgi:hypothetical protein
MRKKKLKDIAKTVTWSQTLTTLTYIIADIQLSSLVFLILSAHSHYLKAIPNLIEPEILPNSNIMEI